MGRVFQKAWNTVVGSKDVSVLIPEHVILHYLANKEDFAEMIKSLKLEKCGCILCSQVRYKHKSFSMPAREAEPQ